MTARLSNPRFEILEELPSPHPEILHVCKARDVEAGQVVLLRIASAEQAQRRGSLLPDARQAVQENELLESPHIARILNAGQPNPDGEIYLASQFVRGITLRERIRRVAPFSLAVAADIASSIAEGVSVAHQRGVVHGALTPSYIILSPEGQIRIADFGLTESAHQVFSPDAAAIETYRDSQSRGRDARATDDIYSLGIILFEMLTGAPPPNAGREQPVSPRSVNPGIPPALDGIILKAIHPDASLRYRDMARMLADLEEVRESLKSGRPLTWSPLATRAARTPRAGREAGAGPLTAAANELEEERETYYREPPSALTVAVRALLVIVVIGVIALAYFGSRFLAIPNDIVVPNLIGKTMDDARVIAKQQNFDLVVGGEDYSTKWPENQIYKQDPDSGTGIKAGRPVTVYRSLGPRLLTMPNLVGMTKERAIQALQDASLPAPTTTDEFSDSVQPGVVISQSIASGTNTARGTIVAVDVSKGPQPPDTPANVQANPSGPGEVDVTWAPSARALTYTVTRTQDGTPKVVASGLKGPQYTDLDVKPSSSYSYTITASNASSQSNPSDPALAITPPAVTSSPSMPSTVDLTPPTDNTTAATDNGGATDANKQAQMRQFQISFRLPRRPRGERHVQFEVQDATGTTLVYDERHPAGDEIDAPVQGFGNKVVLRIFVDGKLMKQTTL